MSRYLNTKYRQLEAYVPGEQPRGRQYIKLNTNESPYPPAPAVVAAVSPDELRDLRLYSDPACVQLKAAIAKTYGVDPACVFVSNGSDDVLNFAFMAFGEDGAAFPDITYGFYAVFCALHGIAAETKPLAADFAVNPADYCGAGKLVALANPNAPTGTALPPGEIERIVRENSGHVVLIDEAYVDFGAESAASLLPKYDNLLVAMTFSKSRSLAGARLGFALGSPALISDLERIKFSTNPYSVNRMTLAAGEAALLPESAAYYANNCAQIAETREQLRGRLAGIGFTMTPSKANFLFAKHETVTGETIYRELKRRGILVRHFDAARIRDYNRITVGTPQECGALADALGEIIKEQG